ncbi:MAG: hypothetical protein Q9200_002044 [Gallowayella weberi]
MSDRKVLALTIARVLSYCAMALSFAYSTATATLNLPFSDTATILCYDPRYAAHKPMREDCLTVINYRIGTSPSARRLQTFSRRPVISQIQLPFTWKTKQDQCRVTVDIPELPGQKTHIVAHASLYQIERAALGVLIECVLREPHLGGMVQTGEMSRLQLRVEAGEDSSSMSTEDELKEER